MKFTKLEYAAWPIGACPACLQRWRDKGLPGQQQELADGGLLLSGYCSEREAGFYTIVAPDGAVTEWTIKVPIAIEEWRAYLDILSRMLAGARAAMTGTAPSII